MNNTKMLLASVCDLSSPPLQPVLTSTYSGKNTPHAGRHGANKENLELNGSILSGGYPSSAPLQRNFSINSVASTYSEFAVIHPF